MNNKKWSIVVFSVFLAFSSNIYSGNRYEVNSLRGLKGVHVLVAKLPPDFEGNLTREQIQTDVELKLRLVGIKVVSEKEQFSMPGRPYLYVTVCGVKTFTEGVAWQIDIQLSQDVYLERDPKISVDATTWSVGRGGFLGKMKIEEIRNEVKDLVDQFINDYLSVNPKGEK